MPSADVDQALNAPIADRARLLLAAIEDQWYDRKSRRITPKKLAEALVGFANADGGVIVVGLSNGVVEGVNGLGSMLNELQQASRDFAAPPVRESHRLLAVRDADGRSDNLLVFEIPPSEQYHETHDGRCFFRVGDENRELDHTEIVELQYDKGAAGQFEATLLPGSSVNELDMALLTNYAQRVGHANEMRLLKDRTGSRDGRLSVAGSLLFAEQPSAHLPSAVVRVSRWDGNHRETGARQNLTSDQRIEGPIPRVILLAKAELQRVQPTRQALRADGRFGAVPLVPEEAWLEGLVNAVVHRSYSLQGDHIHIDVFDNRIEVTSPGRFPRLANLDDPLSARRFARNPRIIRVCSDMKICQELGEGIRRMFDEMRQAGLTDPLYKQSSGAVTLTLSAEAAHRRLDGEYGDLARTVLGALRGEGRLSTYELSKVIGRERPATRRILRQMEVANLIEWVGNSPKDPRAFWRLVDPTAVPGRTQ